MRGEELLDKLELVDPAYVEAADEKPVRKNYPGSSGALPPPVWGPFCWPGLSC